MDTFWVVHVYTMLIKINDYCLLRGCMPDVQKPQVVTPTLHMKPSGSKAQDKRGIQKWKPKVLVASFCLRVTTLSRALPEPVKEDTFGKA